LIDVPERSRGDDEIVDDLSAALEFLRLIVDEAVNEEQGVALADFEGRLTTKDASLA